MLAPPGPDDRYYRCIVAVALDGLTLPSPPPQCTRDNNWQQFLGCDMFVFLCPSPFTPKPLSCGRECSAPPVPDASDVRVMDGVCLPSDDIMLMPFQSVRKLAHHCRSDLNPDRNRMWCVSSLTVDARLIMRRKKARPGFTMWVACCR